MSFIQLLDLLSSKNQEYAINRIKEELAGQDKNSEDVYEKWCNSNPETEYTFSELDSQEDIDIAEVLLHIAAHLGKLETVKYLVDKESANINAKGYLGCTALHFAAERGHLEVIKYLVNKGANINKQDKLGFTPLIIAARNGYNDVVEYFISQANAKIDIKSYGGCTLLHFAAESGNLEVVKYLIEDLKGGKKVYINAKNGDDSTPLHLAAESGNLDVVEYLVKNGAYIDARDVDGETPSDIANENDHQNIVRYLNRKCAAHDENKIMIQRIAAKRAKLDKAQSNKADIKSPVLTVTSILRLNQMSLD